jgi:hypothetical protein
MALKVTPGIGRLIRSAGAVAARSFSHRGTAEGVFFAFDQVAKAAEEGLGFVDEQPKPRRRKPNGGDNER